MNKKSMIMCLLMSLFYKGLLLAEGRMEIQGESFIHQEPSHHDLLAQKLQEELAKKKAQEKAALKHTSQKPSEHHTVTFKHPDEGPHETDTDDDDDNHGLTPEEFQAQMEEIDALYGQKLNKTSSFKGQALKDMLNAVPDEEDEEEEKEDEEDQEEWDDDDDWNDEDEKDLNQQDTQVEEEAQTRLENAVDVLSRDDASQADIIEALDTSKVPTIDFDNPIVTTVADPVTMQKDVEDVFFEQFAKEMRELALKPKISKSTVHEKGEVLNNLHSMLDRATHTYRNTVEKIRDLKSMKEDEVEDLIEERDEIFEGVDKFIKKAKKGMISKEMKQKLTLIEEALKVNINRAIRQKLPQTKTEFAYNDVSYTIEQPRNKPIFHSSDSMEENEEVLEDTMETALPLYMHDQRNVVETANYNIENFIDFVRASMDIMSKITDPANTAKGEQFCKELSLHKDFLKAMRARYKTLSTSLNATKSTDSFTNLQRNILIRQLKTMDTFLKKPTYKTLKQIVQEKTFYDGTQALQIQRQIGKIDTSRDDTQVPSTMKGLKSSFDTFKNNFSLPIPPIEGKVSDTYGRL